MTFKQNRPEKVFPGTSSASSTSPPQPGQHMYAASALNIATVDATLAAVCSVRNGQTRSGSGIIRKPQPPYHKSIDRYSSIDSEDTFLSCNTHPFPSQGPYFYINLLLRI